MALSSIKHELLEELNWLKEEDQRLVLDFARALARKTPKGTPGKALLRHERYATRVETEEEELTSTCTCPVGETCKHAVAVVLEYLERLKQKSEVPTVTEQDRRFALLEETREEESWNGEDEEEEDADRFTPRRSGKAVAETLHPFLEQQTKAQLIALVEELAERYPVVHEALKDRPDLLCRGAERFWEQERTAADWNLLAEKLLERLKPSKSLKGEDNFSRNYRRDRLSNWVIVALENAGRPEEIIPLCEQEAEETGSYIRLVNSLKEAGRWEEAEQWIHRGIKATQNKWPGIANELRTALREMREKANDWLSVAALRAEDVFQQPTLSAFQELQKAAGQAGVWPAVRAAAMHYLETGELPRTTKRAAKDRTIPPWPLPETGVMEPIAHREGPFPLIETLIDIAIAEKRPDEVIRWYDERKPGSIGWGWRGVQDDNIAEAVVETYPDRALAIWQKIAEALIAQTQPSAYETAARYLRKVQQVLRKLGREKEWHSYLAQLRQANARKRRLLEILDNLAGRRIIDVV